MKKRFFERYNTLRNQILILFVAVMSIVLLFVGLVTFQLVSDLIKDNAEAQMKQTAVEAAGRIDSLYDQINLISKQAATHTMVQQVLENEQDGVPVLFQERQQLIQHMNELLAYSNGITSVELYTNVDKQIIPLGRSGTGAVLKSNWKQKADENKGSLVWIGEDSSSPYDYLAIRRVNLLNDSFEGGGYLLIKVAKNYFQLVEKSTQTKGYMVLLDQTEQIISSNYTDTSTALTIVPDKKEGYMEAEQYSALTGWRLMVFTPETIVMEGMSVVRSAVLISGFIGFLLFFVLSYFMSTVVTKPIFQLMRTMKRGRKGKLSLQPLSSSTIEINELNKTYNQMAGEINHLIQVVYEKELLRSKTELKALQSQINPHFLFNTLNALYWALEEKDEELAEQVIAMSELFRYTIETDEWVRVKQEIQHIERYMQLMKLRIGTRFSWEINVPEPLLHVRMPKLLIQPLVENALIHGVAKKTGNGHVSVDLKAVDAFIHVTVADNGMGMKTEQVKKVMEAIQTETMESLKGNGIAMINVNKRLQLYYPAHTEANLRISSIYGQGTVCTFELPVKEGEQLVQKDNSVS